MNRRRLLDRLSEASDAVERLREELNQIDANKDDWAAFLFAARQRYRWSVDHATKSGKSVRATIKQTFETALEYGYSGGWENWNHLLQIPQTKPPEKGGGEE